MTDEVDGTVIVPGFGSEYLNGLSMAMWLSSSNLRFIVYVNVMVATTGGVSVCTALSPLATIQCQPALSRYAFRARSAGYMLRFPALGDSALSGQGSVMVAVIVASLPSGCEEIASPPALLTEPSIESHPTEPSKY